MLQGTPQCSGFLPRHGHANLKMSLLNYLPDAIPCFFQPFDFSQKLRGHPGPGHFLKRSAPPAASASATV